MKKKETRYIHNQADNNNNGNRDRDNYDSQDLVFAATSKNESVTEDIWICDSGEELVDIIATLLRVCSMLKRSKRASRLVMAKV
jgi:hypothetical protein